MNINLKCIYTNGDLTIIELVNGDERKTVVFDCGSNSCSWHSDMVDLNTEGKETFEAYFNGTLSKLPLSYSTDKIEEKRLIKTFQELNSIRPNIIILSHEDMDHYNLLPLFDLREVEKIICYDTEFIVNTLEQLLKKKVETSNIDIKDIKDIKDKICLNELINEDIYKCITLYPVNWQNAVQLAVGRAIKRNNTALVAVVHGDKNSAFLPGDSSPDFWTQEIMDEIIKCKFIMLPHHGDQHIIIGQTEKTVPSSILSNTVIFASSKKQVGFGLDISQYKLMEQLLGKEINEFRKSDVLDSDIILERLNDDDLQEYYINVENNSVHLLFLKEYADDSGYKEVTFTL